MTCIILRIKTHNQVVIGTLTILMMTRTYQSDTDTETNSKAETAHSNQKPELTGENLVTDITKNNVKTETDEVLVINITQTPEQNPDNKKQNPDNK